MNKHTTLQPFLVFALCFLSITESARTFAMDIDFTETQDVSLWQVTNDTVMGGMSRSTVNIQNNELIFSGTLSLKNNGGFTSVWRQPDELKLVSRKPISVKARGDGRTYQLRFRTKKAPEIAYFAEFTTLDDKAREYRFEQTDFTAVWRGRPVTNAPAFSFEDVVQVGFLLADKQPGYFALFVHAVKQPQ